MVPPQPIPDSLARKRHAVAGLLLGVAVAAFALPAMAQAPPLRGSAEEPAPPDEPPPPPRRKPVGTRPYVPGEVAVRRVEPAPLRRTSPPALTPPPEPPRRRPAVEADPFAPTGFQHGGFRIRPAIEFETGFDTNPNRTAGPKKGSARMGVFGEIAAESEWARHAASLFLRGGYLSFPGDKAANRPQLDARGTLRLDATRDTLLDAAANLRIDTQSPFTTDLPFATAKRPPVYTGDVSLGATQRFNRLSVGLRGTVARSVYADAETGGGIVDLSDRNFNTYRAALRLGYEVTPGLKPFVEASADRRRYDVEVNALGLRRSSDGVALRAGTTFELTRTLTGEIAAGYETRKYDDTTLADLRGFVGEASLVWSASPLTTVTLKAASSLDETTVAGLPGTTTRKVTLQVDHALRRWLTASAAIGAARTEFGSVLPAETTLSGSLRLDYKLSRTVVLRTSFTHERFSTATPGRDYTANVFLVGLRLQR